VQIDFFALSWDVQRPFPAEADYEFLPRLEKALHFPMNVSWITLCPLLQKELPLSIREGGLVMSSILSNIPRRGCWVGRMTYCSVCGGSKPVFFPTSPCPANNLLVSRAFRFSGDNNPLPNLSPLRNPLPPTQYISRRPPLRDPPSPPSCFAHYAQDTCRPRRPY
jgi:hypothetical protein